MLYQKKPISEPVIRDSDSSSEAESTSKSAPSKVQNRALTVKGKAPMLLQKGSQGEVSVSKGAHCESLMQKGAQCEVPTQEGGQCAMRPETMMTESDVAKGQSKRTTDLSMGDDNVPHLPQPKPRYNPHRNSQDEDIGDGQSYSFAISMDIECNKHDLYLLRH
jgi:hypothetical protein